MCRNIPSPTVAATGFKHWCTMVHPGAPRPGERNYSPDTFWLTESLHFTGRKTLHQKKTEYIFINPCGVSHEPLNKRKSAGNWPRQWHVQTCMCHKRNVLLSYCAELERNNVLYGLLALLLGAIGRYERALGLTTRSDRMLLGAKGIATNGARSYLWQIFDKTLLGSSPASLGVQKCVLTPQWCWWSEKNTICSLKWYVICSPILCFAFSLYFSFFGALDLYSVVCVFLHVFYFQKIQRHHVWKVAPMPYK